MSSSFETSDESDIEDIDISKKKGKQLPDRKTKKDPSSSKSKPHRPRVEIEYEVEHETPSKLSAY